MLSRGTGSFVADHDHWVAESKIDPHNRSVYEDAVLSKALRFAFTHDELNGKNLLSLEYLNRRRQLIREAHREDVSKPSFEGAPHFMGNEYGLHGSGLVPSLRAHVAQEMSKEAAIAKERRKAREACADAKKKP